MTDRKKSRCTARFPLASTARLSLTLLAGLLASTAGFAAPPSAAEALKLTPVQADVRYEQVPTEELSTCVVRDIDIKGWTGWEVASGDGTVLRRFADTNADNKIDLWCYFNQGIEVYRDIDGNYNRSPDQYRWLGTEGTRWGLDENEDGKIDLWKRISAEEVTAELVRALGEADPVRFTRLLATPGDLTNAGVSADAAERLVDRMKRAAADFTGLAKRQTTIGPETQWVQFAAPAPAVIPSGTDGATSDLVVYENVVAMYETKKTPGQLLVGSMIQVGDAWRLVGLPSIGTDGEPVAQSAGVFLSPGLSSGGTGALGSPADDATQRLVATLEKLDQQLLTAGDSDASKLHAARADVVERLIAAAGNKLDRETWTRQLVDTVSVATQSGKYPEGLARLAKVSATYCEGNETLAAYADYQTIATEYVTRQTKDADFEKVQTWYLESLEKFVKRYPRTNESAQAMLQLALSKEFEDKEREALGYYKTVATEFTGTDMGKKAAGAVRRLESIGKPVELQGKTIGGDAFQLSKYRGRPVVLHYWATWCEPCKQDMVLLRRLQARYKSVGLTLVGINVDASRADAEGFLKANPLTWVQLFEEGGLESSPLSNAFGVQTLPTMMLIDKQGNMARHNVRAAELDAEIEKIVK
ncbi:redoxin domain-containing protein [Stieleria varia]|uniref:Thiol-disulfide oxidoreductase ResA n=1 Tax=Stieleria varia TaxID=2528005 RepID=A0A5C6A5M1_9BACT|nr:redoxin family protein [Stieleria varia]TWT94680.1 Thiol-disulfide oxidoreductase ResA [Stieleria varia]